MALRDNEKLIATRNIPEVKDIKAENVVFTPTEDITSTNVQGAIEEVNGKVFIETLSASDTEIVITDENIKADSTIDIYTSVYGVSPKNVVCVDGSLTITFKALDDDVDVKVVVR